MSEISSFQPDPVLLLCDNKVAIQIYSNPIFHEHTKHIKLVCHFVREKISVGIIMAHHVQTIDQVADLFMKALGGQQHIYLMSKLGLKDIYGVVSLRGSVEDQLKNS